MPLDRVSRLTLILTLTLTLAFTLTLTFALTFALTLALTPHTHPVFLVTLIILLSLGYFLKVAHFPSAGETTEGRV